MIEVDVSDWRPCPFCEGRYGKDDTGKALCHTIPPCNEYVDFEARDFLVLANRAEEKARKMN